MIAENFEVLINCAPNTILFDRELKRAKNESVSYWLNGDNTIHRLMFLDNSRLLVNESERIVTVETR